MWSDYQRVTISNEQTHKHFFQKKWSTKRNVTGSDVDTCMKIKNQIVFSYWTL